MSYKPKAVLLDPFTLLMCDLLGCNQQAALTLGRLRLCKHHANLYAAGRMAMSAQREDRPLDTTAIESERELDVPGGDPQ